jgi:hypothetical protein
VISGREGQATSWRAEQAALAQELHGYVAAVRARGPAEGAPSYEALLQQSVQDQLAKLAGSRGRRRQCTGAGLAAV